MQFLRVRLASVPVTDPRTVIPETYEAIAPRELAQAGPRCQTSFVFGESPGGRGHAPRPAQNIGYAGTGPKPAQVSQISWPQSTLLGVAVHACPTAQISGTGIVVPR